MSAELIGLGNALLDVVAEADEGFLAARELEKGAMIMVDEPRAQAIHGALVPQAELSGGTIANTLSAMAAMDAQTRFIGIVREDAAGARFCADLEAQGVAFGGVMRRAGPATGRCMVMVTPDAQRSMATFLGAGATLDPADIPEHAIEGAQIVYAEAYLWDAPQGSAAVERAAQLARKSGARMALNLSDPLCVERHRGALEAFIRAHAAILIANEAEICAFHQARDFDHALAATRALNLSCGALTRSEKGAMVFDQDGAAHIPACPAERVLDTTGAGDVFAAGFLHRLLRGRSIEEAGRVGARAAALIIGQFGARAPRALLQDKTSESAKG